MVICKLTDLTGAQNPMLTQ